MKARSHESVQPEIGLLLHCLRGHADRDVDQEIRDHVAAGVDWTVLIQAALSHGVTPLLYRGLERVCPQDVPEELLQALRSHVEGNRQRCHALAEELMRILDGLEGMGIPVIPFKGPVLAVLAYGDLAMRRAGDLDLLVRQEHLGRVCDLLLASGYQRLFGVDTGRQLTAVQEAVLRRYDCECQFVRNRDGITVELHCAIAPGTLAVPLDYGGMWARARPMPLDGRQVLGLALEDLLLALCVHGSKHGWSQLRWICDIAGLIDRHPGVEWSVVLERARAQGAERMVLLGLALANHLLGTALPGRVVHRLEVDREALRLTAETVGRACGGGHTPALAWDEPSLRYQRRMRERRRDQVRYVLRTFTLPEAYDVGLVALPRWLHFFYFPIKLVRYSAVQAWLVAKPVFGWTGKSTAARRGVRARQRVRRHWSAAADAWDHWADDLRRRSDWLNTLLVEVAHVGPGQTVLDLASGVGEPALSLARQVGQGGWVVATDLVPGMLVGARRRAAAGSVDTLAFCAADMEQLPFADASFDRVVCRLGIMFCRSVEAALLEARRVLRPEGRATFAVWGPREANTMFDVLFGAVADFFREAYDHNQETALRFGAPGQLAALMRRAGFAEVEERESRRDTAVHNAKDFWRPQFEMTFGAVVQDLPDSLRAALDQCVEVAFARRLEETAGRVFTHVRIVGGRRP